MRGKWWEFIDYGPVYHPTIKQIPIRQFGIPKIVIVRTKKNGGISVKNIPVKA